MLKCFTANNEKPSLRLADKKAKEQRAKGRRKGTTGRGLQMQQLKIISTILKFIWRKQKRKQKSKEQNARQKQSRFTFLRHTPKGKKEKQKNQLA